MIREQVVVAEQPFCSFGWSSWSSIIAGVVTAVALSIVMAVFGMALDFAVVDPMSDAPLAGMGTAFGFWSILSVIVSFAGGGFVAGMLAGRRGPTHGFLVWAVVLLIGTFFSGIAVSSAVKLMGSAIGAVGSGTTQVVASVSKASAEAVSDAFSKISRDMDATDSDMPGSSMERVLRDTGIEKLQPSYLKQQLREAGSNLRKTLYQLSLNPSSAEQILSDFLNKESARLQSLSAGIDKEAAIKGLMQTRDMPRSEAERLVDGALQSYDQGLNKARTVLSDIREQVQDAKVYLKDMTEQARKQADAAASALSGAALAAGVALIAAALISMFAAMYGTRRSVRSPL